MAQHIMDRNKLYLPSKTFKNVFFLCHELFVTVGYSDVVQKLIDTWISLLKIFCAYKQTGESN